MAENNYFIQHILNFKYNPTYKKSLGSEASSSSTYIYMDLAKFEMAESNYFIHHILIFEPQTHTQKRGLGSEALSFSSYIYLAKEEIAESNYIAHHILNSQA